MYLPTYEATGNIFQVSRQTRIMTAPAKSGEGEYMGFFSRLFAKREPTLIEAAVSGNIPLLRELIVAGGDVNQPMPDGMTPLIAAVFRKQAEAAKVLVEAGADVLKEVGEGY